MLDRLRGLFTKRPPRSYLDKYLTDDLMEALVDEPWTFAAPPPEARQVAFIIVNVDDRDPARAIASISEAVSICARAGCTIDTIDGPLIRAVAGMFGPPEAPEPQPDRASIVGELQRALGAGIRIAHGDCEALVGQFGSEERVTHGALIPNFNAVLRMLLDLDFGKAIEIPFAAMPLPRS